MHLGSFYIDSAEILTEKSRIIGKFFAAGFFEFVKKIFYSKFFLFLTLDIQNDLSLPHHDQTIAMSDSITHVVGDHHGCQVITVYDHVGDLEDFGSSFWYVHPEEEAEAFLRLPSEVSMPDAGHRRGVRLWK